jgi:hypothetical protein
MRERANSTATNVLFPAGYSRPSLPQVNDRIGRCLKYSAPRRLTMSKSGLAEQSISMRFLVFRTLEAALVIDEAITRMVPIEIIDSTSKPV